MEVTPMPTLTNLATNMRQIKEFNNKYICLSLRTHLLYKSTWRTTPTHMQCRNNLSKLSSLTTTSAAHSHFFRGANKSAKQFCYQILSFLKQHFILTLMLLMVSIEHVQSLEVKTNIYSEGINAVSSRPRAYSQLLATNGHIRNLNKVKDKNTNDFFLPFVPTRQLLTSHNMFASSGQLHVFQPSNMELETGFVSKSHFNDNSLASTKYNVLEHETTVHQQYSINATLTHHNHSQIEHGSNIPQIISLLDVQQNENSKKIKDDFTTYLKSLEGLLYDYLVNLFERGKYQPAPGLVIELQKNNSKPLGSGKRNIRHTAYTDAQLKLDVPRTLATGRVLFLTGLKKVLWPVFMGLQVLKSLLIAMLIPALIGSFTRLLGKGITTGSAPLFIRPMDPPQELDFRDNSLSFDDDNTFLVSNEGLKDNSPYAYNHPDASQMQNEYVFDPASSHDHLQSYTRLGMNERQHQLMQDSYMNALQSIGSASFKNSGSLSSSSSVLLAPMAKRPPPAANVNTFQQFQNVPESSLLLSNYDPFYSPLLSRLDSVFAQLKINSDKEICREKLICLMYANPAKYAPYSNLVSAQLSRELNELRKPTSDNPDILRFFKYMRAAKDGQDGVDCEKTFDNCMEFKDFENPAMVSTYHDINKLVQARKFK